MSLVAHTARKGDLLALPMKEWGEERGWYAGLLIVPSRKKHDSGYAQIAIIGVDRDGNASHILAMPDDIQWPANTAISPSMPNYGDLRTDCYWPSGVLRVWSGKFDLSVSMPVSSVEILVRERVKAA